MLNKQIYQSCRICLVICVNGKSFDEDENLLKLYEYCCGLTVGTTAPRFLCKSCLIALKKFSQFKIKCVESENFWESQKATNNTIDNKNDPNNDNKDFNAPIKTEDSESETDQTEYTGTELIEYNEDNSEPKQAQRNEHSKSNHDEILIKKSQGVLNSSIDEKQHDCGLCRVISANEIELKEHLLSHWRENSLKCQLCNYIGKDFAHMVAHRYTHKCDVEPGKMIRCFLCSKSRGDPIRLQFHFRRDHMKQDGGWCEVCDKKFTDAKTFKAHMKKHNNFDELFICAYCDKRFAFKCYLEEHIIIHLGILKTHMCEICGFVFRRKGNLRLHQLCKHSKDQCLKCTHCDKVYKNEISLAKHMHAVTRKKPYVCDICPKRFATPSTLKVHIFYHSGQKPFPCDVCGNKYKTKSALRVHKLKHSGSFNFTCTECDMRFFTSSTLKRHQLIHSGVKKFNCEECGKGFFAKYRYVAHLAKHKS